MNNAPRTPWLAAAVVQALLIVWLAVQLAQDAATAPAAAAPPIQPGAPAITPAPANATPSALSPREAADAPGTATPAPTVDGSPGTIVHGAVRVRGGGSVAGASVYLFAGDAPEPIESMALERATHFCWPLVPPGAYRLRAAAAGLRAFEHTFAVHAGQPDLRIDVAFEPSWLLHVRLEAPDGRALYEALSGAAEGSDGTPTIRVIVAPTPFGERVPAPDPEVMASDPQLLSIAKWTHGGEFGGALGLRVRPGHLGLFDLGERRPVVVAAVAGDCVLAQMPVEPTADDVTIVVDPARARARMATLRVQFVDTDRRPVAGVSGQAWSGMRTTSDDQGRFVAQLPPGRSALLLNAPNRCSVNLHVELAPGQTTDLGTFVLQPQVMLNLRVAQIPPGGQVRVTAHALDAPRNAALRGTPVTLRGGAFGMPVLPGRYRIRATGGGGAVLDVDTATAGNQPIAVTLAPEAMVRFDAKDLREPVHVVVQTSDGEVLVERSFAATGAWQTPLLPGAYTVRVRTLAGAERIETLTVPAAGTTFPVR